MFLPTPRWLWGAAVLSLVALAGLLRSDGLAWLVVGDGIWLLLLLADGLLVPPPGVLQVQRETPPAFSVGRVFPVRYRWSQPTRRPLVMSVREALPPPLGLETPERRFTVPPGGEAVEVLEILPARRGRGSGGRLWLRVRGPLGLVWRQAIVERPWSATVYPNLTGASLRALPTQIQRRREAGLRNVRRLGEGRVFETLKEWVPGEDTRTIDWKATARRGKIMARQYEDERRQHVMIVLDAGRMMTAEIGGGDRLEAAAEAALRLAYAAVDHDDNVGLMVFADRVQVYVPPMRGRRALRAVLEGLADAEGRMLEPDYPAAFFYLAGRNRKRALTVLFTDVVDRTASEALVAQLGTLRPRHLPLAVTLRDPVLERLGTRRPATVPQAYDRAAAEELLAAREEALADMRRRGVLVLDVPPARAAEAVVHQYDWLKRRGMI